MSLQTLALILIVPAVFGLFFYLLSQMLNKLSASQRMDFEKLKTDLDLQRDSLREATQHQKFLLDSLNTMRGSLDKNLLGVQDQLQKGNLSLGQRLDNAARVVQEVSKGLGGLSEATKRILDVGKDISGLQEILRSPKLRGGLGELFLGDLLGQIFPPAHFSLQHRFKSGETVDAVIKLGKNLVPVDAKFPLENFKRLVGETPTEEERTVNKKKFIADVKKHIDAIADKYILPDEGTFDFALMYIPAENVYYEIIIKDEAIDTDKGLLNYAFTKRVIPVSPNSFYAYLQTILLGLKGIHIEARAQEILQSLGRLSGDFHRFQDEFEIVGKHLNNTKTKYEEADKRLAKFTDRLQLLTGTANLPNEEEEREKLEAKIIEEAPPSGRLPLD
ncbi:MAG: DNA recombination protein RmuC [Patescibacteria group bacterium]